MPSKNRGPRRSVGHDTGPRGRSPGSDHGAIPSGRTGCDLERHPFATTERRSTVIPHGRQAGTWRRRRIPDLGLDWLWRLWRLWRRRRRRRDDLWHRRCRRLVDRRIGNRRRWRGAIADPGGRGWLVDEGRCHRGRRTASAGSGRPASAARAARARPSGSDRGFLLATPQPEQEGDDDDFFHGIRR